MIRIILNILVLIPFVITFAQSGEPERLVWPPAPDVSRVVFVEQIKMEKLKLKKDFLSKIGGLLSGGSNTDQILLPFDIVVADRYLYAICQNLDGLVEINRDDRTYRVYRCKELPIGQAISLCDGGDGVIYLTDVEQGIVYKFKNETLKPFIHAGLVRPTGITHLPYQQRIYVVDTGDHSLKLFDYEGNLLKSIYMFGEDSVNLYYPTFAANLDENNILLNDALNYQIRQLDSDGNLLNSFGREGDGPGCFARPKGLGVDSHGHIYVVDNIFDNIQIFDGRGRLLLVIGGNGIEPGQFWSPAGIDISSDTIYVADTYNNRIQVLHYLGEGQ